MQVTWNRDVERFKFETDEWTVTHLMNDEFTDSLQYIPISWINLVRGSRCNELKNRRNKNLRWCVEWNKKFILVIIWVWEWQNEIEGWKKTKSQIETVWNFKFEPFRSRRRNWISNGLKFKICGNSWMNFETDTWNCPGLRCREGYETIRKEIFDENK